MKNEKTNGKHGNDGKHNSHSSQKSHQPVQPQPAPPPDPTRVLPPRGDYQTLLHFQKAEIVHDVTIRFAHKYLSKGDRTIDQMIQSARSGKQNILEGSKAGTTSKETEIKLTNVGRASLEELLADFQRRGVQQEKVYGTEGMMAIAAWLASRSAGAYPIATSGESILSRLLEAVAKTRAFCRENSQPSSQPMVLFFPPSVCGGKSSCRSRCRACCDRRPRGCRL